MKRRQPLPQSALPTLWLMTDDGRDNDPDHAALFAAMVDLPAGSGVIFRHYGLDATARRVLARRVVKLARQKGLIILWSGRAQDAVAIGAHGVHAGRAATLPRKTQFPHLIRSAPVHNLREMRRAERAGADMLLLSPILTTRSHPSAPHLGVARATRMMRAAHLPVIALGGITQRQAPSLMRLGFAGWAGISGLYP